MPAPIITMGAEEERGAVIPAPNYKTGKKVERYRQQLCGP
jgi:hypothetical protein